MLAVRHIFSLMHFLLVITSSHVEFLTGHLAHAEHKENGGLTHRKGAHSPHSDETGEGGKSHIETLERV